MKTLHAFFACVLVALLLAPATSNAIPAFARKYGFNCNMCHTAYTKLNDFGQRYRDNGYQIPGQQGGEKTVFDIAPPLSMRTTAGLSTYSTSAGTTAGFNLFGLDLLAAGVLHKNISFLLIYTPRIDEPAADYRGPDLAGPAQTGTLESANLVFSNVVQDALNFRVGRFEPAYHPFSSKRKYTIFAPYDVYTFGTPSNTFNFDDNQIGIEATGHFRSGFKYGFGMVNGNGANPDLNVAKDFYVNLFQTFGKGDGQTAGQRVGAFAYLGWQPTSLTGTIVAPTGETNGKENKSFYRLGVDGSLTWESFNLNLLFMNGSDDKALNTLDSTNNYTYTGGIAELEWAGLLNNRMVASLTYNFVRPPSYDNDRQIDAITLLLRYYMGGWEAVNVAMHAEYTYRTIGKNNPMKENQFALVLDFDF
jgi:hypothetical protein